MALSDLSVVILLVNLLVKSRQFLPVNQAVNRLVRPV